MDKKRLGPSVVDGITMQNKKPLIIAKHSYLKCQDYQHIVRLQWAMHRTELWGKRSYVDTLDFLFFNVVCDIELYELSVNL